MRSPFSKIQAQRDRLLKINIESNKKAIALFIESKRKAIAKGRRSLIVFNNLDQLELQRNLKLDRDEKP
jgi:hypothetical protein